MHRGNWLRSLSVVCVLLAATTAFAQGTTGSVNGTVTDNTGAVLPGVTIAASSPSLMGVQTAVTNEQGQYRFPTLPPGSYRLEYQLPGFTTVVRDQIVVQITFTSTVNVQLQVATLQETVTVTGASPVVDTQNTQIQTNFTQEMIRNLPNARDIWALIAVAPGTTMGSFDVGGSRAGTQTGYSAYGRSDQVRVQVDGANATEDTGGTGYFNYGAFEEVSIGTDSNDASMPTPGVQINAVVKSGGNQFRGDLYMDFQHSSMQGKNVSDEQKQKGLGEGTRITKYYDPNLGIGGPIKRDKIWYFVSLRKQFSGSNIGGFPVEDPGTFEFRSQLENMTEKTTYQLSQNNKLAQFFEFRRKLQPSRGAASTLYQDAVYKQESISSYGTVEWNSVVSPSFFMNTRFSSWGYNWPNYAYGPDGLGQNVQPRRTERLTGNVSGGAREDKTYRRRFQVDWGGSYFKDEFLGSNHTVRVGFTSEQETQRDLDHGFVDEYTAMFDSAAGQADFTRPWRVQIGNTAREATDNLRHLGAFIQDQIVVNRKLTLNAGFRWDYYHVFYPEQEIRESRFRDFFYAGAALPNGYRIPASYPDFVAPGRDVVLRFPAGFAPRFGVAYDLSGDGKTVLKVNWGRYKSNPGPQGFVNPIQSQTSTFEWLDCRNGATPIACAAGQRGDGSFDINEVGTFVSSAGGSFNTIDPDLKQEYTDDVSFFVEREIIANLGVRAGYVRKIGKNNWEEVEIGRRYEDYTDARTFSDPGPDGVLGNGDDGARYVAYDYPAGVTIPASRTDLRNVDSIESWDQNFDLTVNKRMSNRWSLLSSFLYNWDHGVDYAHNPNDERFKELDLTNWAFKFFGTYQAPWAITLNPVLRYQQGVTLAREVPTTLRTGTLNYDAEAEGTYRSENVAIFDIALERRFRLGASRHVDAFFAAFNALNSNAATGQDSIVGVRNVTLEGVRYDYARFLRPTGALPPRVFRFGVKLAF
jgi:Carboxypeptidase regulatory-like domain